MIKIDKVYVQQKKMLLSYRNMYDIQHNQSRNLIILLFNSIIQIMVNYMRRIIHIIDQTLHQKRDISVSYDNICLDVTNKYKQKQLIGLQQISIIEKSKNTLQHILLKKFLQNKNKNILKNKSNSERSKKTKIVNIQQNSTLTFEKVKNRFFGEQKESLDIPKEIFRKEIQKQNSQTI
ncbi:hypothetical protein pb186bvf_003655 [Paramecium bursaria]